MVEVTHFEGREWINATEEYFRLPPRFVLSTDKWERRLKHIHIAYARPDVRTTKRGNIAVEEEMPRVRKDVYVVKTVWDAAMRKCQEQGPHARRSARVVADPVAPVNTPDCEAEGDQPEDDGGAPDQAASEDETDDATGAGTLTLQRITLNHGEYFVHDGHRYDIKMYGERTADGLYLDARDVAACINMRFTNMPSSILVKDALVDGESILALPWFAFLHLAFLKAASHPVAKAIGTWVSDTMFMVQYEGGVGVATQAEFASRRCRYSLETYIGHLDAGDQIIYAIDALPAGALESAYPGTVAPLVADRDLASKRIIKMGCGKRERIGAVRADLNKILPGHDPRPIFVVRVPSVSDRELEDNFEKALHMEFADVRIGCDGRASIPGPRHDAYTELFLIDADMKELAHRKASSLVDRHIRVLSEASDKVLRDTRSELSELVEVRMDNRVKETKIQHLETALGKSETALEKSETALRKSDEECMRLKDTIAQLLPRKMSALKSAFSRLPV